MSDDPVRSCQGCGSEITNEQVSQRQAGLVQGILLCPECVEEKRREATDAQASAQRAVAAAETRAYIPAVREKEEDAPLSLIDEEQMSGKGEKMIRSFAEGSTLGGAHDEAKLKRPLAGPSEPASRCRTFHGKLTAAGLANMDEILNEWLDNQPGVYIKSVSSSVGVFEGKNKEPHVIMTVFY